VKRNTPSSNMVTTTTAIIKHV